MGGLHLPIPINLSFVDAESHYKELFIDCEGTMDVLKKIYDAFDKAVSAVIVILMVMILALISLQVVFRFFLHKSMGGFEELPVFLLLSMVWVGGILVAKRDDHVKIDLLTGAIQNPSAKAALSTAMSLITAVCSALYTALCWTFVMNAIEHRTLSPALRFPVWYVYAVTLVASGFNTLFFAINTITDAYHIFKPVSEEDEAK